MGIRSDILSGIAGRLQDQFGPEGETAQCLTRAQAQPWQPGRTANNPQAWVADAGQRKATGRYHSEDDKLLELEAEITLGLRADWEAEYLSWCDYVQQMIVSLTNWLPDVAGAMRCDYLEDSPFDVVLTRGGGEQIWIVRMGVRYEQAVGLIGKE